MAGYVHPEQAERDSRDSVKRRLANLRGIEAAIRSQEIAREEHLATLQVARRKWLRAGDYTPSPEALQYREQYGHIIAAQPAPIHGGRAGLEKATREIEEHSRRKANGDPAWIAA